MLGAATHTHTHPCNHCRTILLGSAMAPACALRHASPSLAHTHARAAHSYTHTHMPCPGPCAPCAQTRGTCRCAARGSASCHWGPCSRACLSPYATPRPRTPSLRARWALQGSQVRWEGGGWHQWRMDTVTGITAITGISLGNRALVWLCALSMPKHLKIMDCRLRRCTGHSLGRRCTQGVKWATWSLPCACSPARPCDLALISSLRVGCVHAPPQARQVTS